MKKQTYLIAAYCIVTLSSFAQFTFVHITDLHVSNTISLVNGFDTNAIKFQCYINEFANLTPKPVFVAASGDICNIGNNGPDGMYPTVTQYLFPSTLSYPGIGAYHIDAEQTIPIYFTPGNHEYYTTLLPPLNNTTLVYYPQYIAPDSDYAVTYDNAVIICMRSGYDDDRPIWEDIHITAPEGSGLSIEQCNWLRNILGENIGKRKIIVMHHPPVNANGIYSDGTSNTSIIDAEDGSILNNRTTFLNICDSNQIDVVLSGHSHQNVVAARAGNIVAENWTGGTRYVQTAAAFNRSYRIITVDSSFVTVSEPLLSCAPDAGVNESANSMNVSVYPNPATHYIAIENKQLSEVEILNLQGQTILQQKVQPGKTTIDISGYPKGIYLLKLINANNISVTKLELY